MNKWADYLVSKVSWKENVPQVESFIVHEDKGDKVGVGTERSRDWIVDKFTRGYTFATIKRNVKGSWEYADKVSYWGGINWGANLPLIRTRRKTFISYYHNDDQVYKDAFQNLTSDLFVNKSVQEGDIKTELSEEYIKQLIQKDYLYDTTVLIVLIGPKTKCRKHVDWEISGALNRKVGETYAGLLGLLLPSHPNYGTGRYNHDLLPARLSDNLKTGYAVIRNYTTDRVKLQEYVELAFRNRKQREKERVNSRAQFQKNLCS